MLNTILELWQYGFIQRAVTAGVFLGSLCATLGVFLLLRRMSLIGEGLAHISFGAIALGLWLSWNPLITAIPLVIIGAIAIQYLELKTSTEGDMAIGILGAIGISTGIILASLGGGFNIDLFSYLFGNILAISPSELIVSIVLSIVVFIVIIVFYYELVYISFDEEQARVAGIPTQFIQSILAILTAVTVVLAIRMVGVLLVSALLILPASTALQISSGFATTIIRSILISISSIILGILLAFGVDLPPGATIVLVNSTIFGFSVLLNIRR